MTKLKTVFHHNEQLQMNEEYITGKGSCCLIRLLMCGCVFTTLEQCIFQVSVYAQEHIYFSHHFSFGEMVGVLSFYRCWSSSMAARHNLTALVKVSGIRRGFPLMLSPPCFLWLFVLMWRLIFTLKAQRCHVTRLPGPPTALCLYCNLSGLISNITN